jgi:hypothetical protein
MDQDTLLTTLYVMIHDFCQSADFAEKHRRGPAASLSWSEVLTLAVFGHWARFRKSNAPSPAMQWNTCGQPFQPCRSAQCNRLQRSYIVHVPGKSVLPLLMVDNSEFFPKR